MDAIEDIFESSLNLEESHLREGYDEGYADGLISGKEEGEQVGLKTGFETGEELGFYRGCVGVWSSAIRADPNFMSARVQKTIKQMDELLQNYTILEPENEAVSDAMDALRLKFKIICASLNLKLEYKGYPKSSDAAADIGF
ncbi:protein LTO1 homolog [Salvia splendens]|uniref:protein LTO1 homolog n=1 Tax=Salvia splendens TaxID=180675 RepID=UPI001C2553A5|nr:protein LTO1 homolog [Salvia splendens]